MPVVRIVYANLSLSIYDSSSLGAVDALRTVLTYAVRGTHGRGQDSIAQQEAMF